MYELVGLGIYFYSYARLKRVNRGSPRGAAYHSLVGLFPNNHINPCSVSAFSIYAGVSRVWCAQDDRRCTLSGFIRITLGLKNCPVACKIPSKALISALVFQHTFAKVCAMLRSVKSIHLQTLRNYLHGSHASVGGTCACSAYDDTCPFQWAIYSSHIASNWIHHIVCGHIARYWRRSDCKSYDTCHVIVTINRTVAVVLVKSESVAITN